MGERADEVTASDPSDQSKPAARPVQTNDITGAYVKARAPGKASKTRASGGPVGQNQRNTGDDALSEGQLTSVPTEDEEIAAAHINIEQTRVEMSETVDAIQEKLSPAHLAQQSKDVVRDATVGMVQDVAGSVVDTAKGVVSRPGSTATQAGSAVAESIKQNPVPVALIGIGLGWLLLRARQAGTGLRTRSLPGVLSNARESRPREECRAHSLAF